MCDFCSFGSSSESQQKDKNLPFSVASKLFLSNKRKSFNFKLYFVP